MKKNLKTLCAASMPIAMLAMASAATAAIYTPDIASKDTIVGDRQSGGSALGYYADSGGGTIGTTGGNGTRATLNAVIGFTLPTLGAGETIDSATLTYRMAGAREQSNGIKDLDVYLLGTSDPDNSGTSLFLGASSDPNTANKFIARAGEADTETINNNSPTFVAPDYTLTFTLPAGVLGSLQSFFTGNTPNQTEAFFRWNLSAGISLNNLNRWSIDTDGADAPILTINTIVPEPASLSLMGLGGLALLRRRRR